VASGPQGAPYAPDCRGGQLRRDGRCQRDGDGRRGGVGRDPGARVSPPLGPKSAQAFKAPAPMVAAIMMAGAAHGVRRVPEPQPTSLGWDPAACRRRQGGLKEGSWGSDPRLLGLTMGGY
jgi:hypothetical protein